MKNFIYLLLSLSLIACSTSTTTPVAAPTEVAALEHPLTSLSPTVDRKYFYVGDGLFPVLKAQIPDFPEAGSLAQLQDEKELLKRQKTRTKKDCVRAFSEITVNLQNFYGKPYGPLNDNQVQALNPFFQKFSNDSGYYIGKIKREYKRQRPYEYIKGMKPCLRKEESFAYPSGHATLSELYSLVLTELFPQKAGEIKKRAEEIALDRVIGGVHHPTDIEYGKKYGQAFFSELLKSKKFQEDMAENKKLIQ